jgi:hypothetical protein
MKYILVKSRHSHRDIDKLPAIFETVNSDQIFDFDLHKKIIHKHLSHLSQKKVSSRDDLILYVTGLTPLLVSVLNYCRLFNISITLYHYDVSSDRYVAQSVV